MLGAGDGVCQQFALRKRYGSAEIGYWRAITRPVAGSVRLALDDVEQASGWTLDATTGVVSLAAPPGAGVVIRAGFEFDVPVRFDSDALDVVLDFERSGTIQSIPLIELRERAQPIP